METDPGSQFREVVEEIARQRAQERPIEQLRRMERRRARSLSAEGRTSARVEAVAGSRPPTILESPESPNPPPVGTLVDLPTPEAMDEDDAIKGSQEAVKELEDLLGIPERRHSDGDKPWTTVTSKRSSKRRSSETKAEGRKNPVLAIGSRTTATVATTCAFPPAGLAEDERREHAEQQRLRARVCKNGKINPRRQLTADDYVSRIESDDGNRLTSTLSVQVSAAAGISTAQLRAWRELKDVSRIRVKDEDLDPPPYACFNCWEQGHERKNCPEPPTIYKFCWTCGRRGAMNWECSRCHPRRQGETTPSPAPSPGPGASERKREARELSLDSASTMTSSKKRRIREKKVKAPRTAAAAAATATVTTAPTNPETSRPADPSSVPTPRSPKPTPVSASMSFAESVVRRRVEASDRQRAESLEVPRNAPIEEVNRVLSERADKILHERQAEAKRLAEEASKTRMDIDDHQAPEESPATPPPVAVPPTIAQESGPTRAEPEPVAIDPLMALPGLDIPDSAGAVGVLEAFIRLVESTRELPPDLRRHILTVATNAVQDRLRH